MVSGDQRLDGNIPIMSFSELLCESPPSLVKLELMVGIR